MADQLMGELFYEFREPALSNVTVELHAGEKYCEPLATILSLLKVNVVRPVVRLGIGEQLAYYTTTDLNQEVLFGCEKVPRR